MTTMKALQVIHLKFALKKLFNVFFRVKKTNRKEKKIKINKNAK